MSEQDSTALAVQSSAAMQPASVDLLIAKAIEHNVPVETMERLMAMRRELKAEAAKEAFVRAMAAFQAECPEIHKSKSVQTNAGKHAYSYAPLEAIVKQVGHLLAAHGFSYRFEQITTDMGVKMLCHVTHAEGHTEETPFEVPFGTKTQVMSDSQVVAAASTFASRYAFIRAFGIMTADEDNDAVDYSKAAPAQQRQQLDHAVQQNQQIEQRRAEQQQPQLTPFAATVVDITYYERLGEIEFGKCWLHIYPCPDKDRIYPGDRVEVTAWNSGQQKNGKPVYVVDPGRWPGTAYSVKDVPPPQGHHSAELGGQQTIPSGGNR